MCVCVIYAVHNTKHIRKLYFIEQVELDTKVVHEFTMIARDHEQGIKCVWDF